MGLAILFPGQGSQSPEMFAQLMQHGGSEGLIDQVLELTGLTLGPDGLSPPDGIFANSQAQPLIVGHGVALWSLLAPVLPRPVAILGYSVGELSAAHAAGALDTKNALTLARQRAQLMEAACNETQAMVAIRGFLAELLDMVEEAGAYPAIFIGPEHLVVAGTAEAVSRLSDRLASTAVTLRPLPVTVASHCPLMGPAVSRLLQALGEVLAPPRLPFISAWNARRAPTRQAMATALAEQIAAPVQWALAIEAALERGVKVFLELGPGDQMTRIVRDLHPRVPARSISEFKVPAAAADWVARAL